MNLSDFDRQKENGGPVREDSQEPTDIQKFIEMDPLDLLEMALDVYLYGLRPSCLLPAVRTGARNIRRESLNRLKKTVASSDKSPVLPASDDDSIDQTDFTEIEEENVGTPPDDTLKMRISSEAEEVSIAAEDIEDLDELEDLPPEEMEELNKLPDEHPLDDMEPLEPEAAEGKPPGPADELYSHEDAGYGGKIEKTPELFKKDEKEAFLRLKKGLLGFEDDIKEKTEPPIERTPSGNLRKQGILPRKIDVKQLTADKNKSIRKSTDETLVEIKVPTVGGLSFSDFMAEIEEEGSGAGEERTGGKNHKSDSDDEALDMLLDEEFKRTGDEEEEEETEITVPVKGKDTPSPVGPSPSTAPVGTVSEEESPGKPKLKESPKVSETEIARAKVIAPSDFVKSVELFKAEGEEEEPKKAGGFLNFVKAFKPSGFFKPRSGKPAVSEKETASGEIADAVPAVEKLKPALEAVPTETPNTASVAPSPEAPAPEAAASCPVKEAPSPAPPMASDFLERPDEELYEIYAKSIITGGSPAETRPDEEDTAKPSVSESSEEEDEDSSAENESSKEIPAPKPTEHLTEEDLIFSPDDWMDIMEGKKPETSRESASSPSGESIGSVLPVSEIPPSAADTETETKRKEDRLEAEEPGEDVVFDEEEDEEEQEEPSAELPDEDMDFSTDDWMDIMDGKEAPDKSSEMPMEASRSFLKGDSDYHQKHSVPLRGTPREKKEPEPTKDGLKKREEFTQTKLSHRKKFKRTAKQPARLCAVHGTKENMDRCVSCGAKDAGIMARLCDKCANNKKTAFNCIKCGKQNSRAIARLCRNCAPGYARVCIKCGGPLNK